MSLSLLSALVCTWFVKWLSSVILIVTFKMITHTHARTHARTHAHAHTHTHTYEVKFNETMHFTQTHIQRA